jgi:hypothetical protein
MASDRDMQAFVVAYQAAWASREPGVMRALWHPDGMLHHPALGRAIFGEVVPYNNGAPSASRPRHRCPTGSTRWRPGLGTPPPQPDYSSPENFSQADCRVIPSASPMRRHETLRSRRVSTTRWTVRSTPSWER